MVVIVMGVAGSGKTTVGSALARKLGWEFLDADAFHSPANVAKMRAGIPLTDADRAPWLAALRGQIQRTLDGRANLALACSALKRSYQEQLVVSSEVKLVYLRARFEILERRLQQRQGHFMTAQMLAGQLATLEEPGDAITVDAEESVDEIVDKICAKLQLR